MAKNTTLDEIVLDTYFTNGFQGYKSVLECRPTTVHSMKAASKIFNEIFNHPDNQKYIEAKKRRLAIRTNIKNEHIVKELINWFYTDITDFIGLTQAELKQLPAEIKRCIASFKVIEKKYIDKSGVQHFTTTTEIKLIDKIKAAEMINKHIGFYEVDNRQKSNNINLTRIDSVTLNNLFAAMNHQEIEK